MVREARSGRPLKDWDDAPVPRLVVEVLSGSTRRRDEGPKRKLYFDAGIPEYWIIDPERQTVRATRPGMSDDVVATERRWLPSGADRALVIAVPLLCRGG
jgi:Uma2 family endonuclease